MAAPAPAALRSRSAQTTYAAPSATVDTPMTHSSRNAPAPGEASRTTPKTIATTPPRTGQAHGSPWRRAATASTIPVMPCAMLHTATISTSASTVGPGQNSITRPATSDTTPCTSCQPQWPARRCRIPRTIAVTPSISA